MFLLAGLYPTEQDGRTQRKARRRSMFHGCYVEVMHARDTFLATPPVRQVSRRTRRTVTARNSRSQVHELIERNNPDQRNGDENKSSGMPQSVLAY